MTSETAAVSIRVALWSRFPDSYVAKKIEPRLRRRGIHVSRYLSPGINRCDLTGVDAVLMMHEMASHSDSERLIAIAEMNKKEVFVFSRKTSFWDRDLSSLIKNNHHTESEDMAAQKAVSDAKLDSFLKKYMELKTENVSSDKMVPALRSFYDNSIKLTNGNQLNQYIRNLRNSSRAPEYFKKFMEKQDRTAELSALQKELDTSCTEKFETKSHAAVTKVLNGTVTTTPTSHKIVSADQKVEKTEAELMDELYKDEMNAKNVRINTLEAENKTLRQKISETAAVNGAANDSVANDSAANNKFKRIFANVIESVDLGILNKEDAFDRLSNFYKKTMG